MPRTRKVSNTESSNHDTGGVGESSSSSPYKGEVSKGDLPWQGDEGRMPFRRGSSKGRSPFENNSSISPFKREGDQGGEVARGPERTLVLVKPDGVQRGLVGTVISRLEKRELKISALKMIWMDEALARQHYAMHKGKAFFDELVDFITASPIIAAVFEGEQAIEAVRQTMGETDPTKATPGTIRGDFGMDIGHNLVHGSDSSENAKSEISLFFSPEEILDYARDIDKWLTES